MLRMLNNSRPIPVFDNLTQTNHQIQKPVSQIFELIKETRHIDPLKEIIIKDNNRVNSVKSITDFFKKK